MKRIVCLLFMSIILTMQLNASSYKMFLGAEAGLTNAQFTDTQGTYRSKELTTYGLKGGVVNDLSRMYISYQYIDAYEGSTLKKGEFQTLTMDTEALTRAYDIYNLFDIRYFIGAHAGAVNINMSSTLANVNKAAFLYGIQTGILIGFDTFFNLEAGYRHSFSNFKAENNDLDYLQTFYAGLNIKF